MRVMIESRGFIWCLRDYPRANSAARALCFVQYTVHSPERQRDIVGANFFLKLFIQLIPIYVLLERLAK